MAGIYGLLLLLGVLHLAKAATRDCTLKEIVTSGTSVEFQTGESTSQTFSLVTIGSTTMLKLSESPGSKDSQVESCAVILKNNQPMEVIMSFHVLDGSTNRFCWKGILRSSVLFYVVGPENPVSTGYTTEQCLSLLGSTSAYNMMMKKPVPSNPNFAVDLSSIIQPGTYRLSYAFDNQQQNCAAESMTSSSVIVGTSSITFRPCGSITTSYHTPFNKELFVAGFVEDSMLDIIQGSDQVGGAFIVLVYHDVGQPFKYYLMRVFQAISTNMQQANYLEMFGTTNTADAYSPTGYVDRRYVPNKVINDVLTLHYNSESCQSSPCKNGGTCVNQWLKFICICPTGFTGDTCQILDDECSKNDHNGSLCSFHGRCVPTADSYTCECNDGYTGPKCQDTTTCRSDTCKNGGTCYDPKIDSLAVCDCVTGYYGAHCEDTETCKTQKPCKNGGTCYDGQNGEYTCFCPTDYTGKNCDGTDRPSPAPLICVEGIEDICRNGGKCIDGKCVCQAYYTGRYCDDINNWFIGSIVLIVLLAVVMVVTLIVCCFFCARGTTLAPDGTEKSYDPFMTGGQDVAKSTSGYGPDGFTANRYPDPSFYNDGYTSRF